MSPRPAPKVPASGVGPPSALPARLAPGWPLLAVPTAGQGQLLGRGLSGGAGSGRRLGVERRPRGAWCCGQEALGSCGAWAWWLWLEQGFWESRKDPLGFFLCPGPPAPPPGGNSGLAQEWGRHVYFWGIGRDESWRAGFWTRGFSKAALLDICRAARFTRAAFHCSHLPETRLTPGAHLHPLPCGLP